MKNYLWIIAVIALAACGSKPQQEGETLRSQRAASDTILSFQGIRISEPLDSAAYAQLRNNMPITLYRQDNMAFTFTDLTINDDYVTTYPGEEVHTLCLKGSIEKYWDFLSFVCLYEENYDCFSYYQRLNPEGKRMGSFPIGKVSTLTGKPYERKDAVSDFVKYAGSSHYTFDFVWEWNNQTIVLTYDNGIQHLNSTVTYSDTGFADRQAEEEVQRMLQESEQRDIEDARSRQQI